MYALWMFYGDQFKEVYSPDIRTWTNQILVDSTESGLPMDLIFSMRALDGRVFVSPPDDFVWGDIHNGNERRLQVEQIYSFQCGNVSVNIQLKQMEQAG